MVLILTYNFFLHMPFIMHYFLWFDDTCTN